jgi:WD40 repeat protein
MAWEGKLPANLQGAKAMRRPSVFIAMGAILLALCVALMSALMLAAVVVSVMATPSPYSTARLAFLVDTGEKGEDMLYLADLTGQVKPVIAMDAVWGTEMMWSPDGKRLAGTSGASPSTPYPENWVVDVEQGRVEGIGSFPYLWCGFAAWTSEGRYAIFGSRDQYGNSDAKVFDAWNWELVIDSTANDCPHTRITMGGECKRRLAAVSPLQPVLFLVDGTLVDLQTLSQSFIFSPTLTSGMMVWSGRYMSTYPAAWSPDGAYLAFVGSFYEHDRRQWDNALYLAHGDGTRLQKAIVLDGELDRVEAYLEWAPSSKAVTLWTESHKYILDVTRMQTQVLSPWFLLPVPDYPCGDTSYAMARMASPSEDVEAACWSPDEFLLAVGISGALKVYDANLRLLRTIPVQGTVQSVAWSPLPQR